MEPATPQALADLIQREKATLVASWAQQVREIPGAPPLDSAILRDHVPLLVDELAAELRQPEKSRERLESFCTAHGELRHQNGFDLGQLVEEYKLLRSCIVRTAEAAHLYVVGDANRVMDELIDEGIKASIRAYIERRDAAEKERREEYLKFLVHDLRSPLSAIYYAILLIEHELEKVSVGEKVWTIQGVIKRNIEQMQALITKLLQEEQNVRTTPAINIERKPVYLGSVADSAVRILMSLATISGTRILNDIPDGLMANADAELLERVFQNLLSNAIDSTPGGTVTVGATSSDDGTVYCWVTDNGRGIPEDMREKVFDKFVTASTQGSGVGLGLPIAKRIIEAHGGTITLENASGQGTTVRFSLPNA
jgi:two-component system, OmpR family, phosphate regulon sensor histidine kinase PhoR